MFIGVVEINKEVEQGWDVGIPSCKFYDVKLTNFLELLLLTIKKEKCKN